MSLLKVNEVQNYNGSSLTLTASTVSTSAQLNTGGNISVTGSLNVSDDSTTRSNLGLGSIATQASDNVTITGGNISSAVLASTVTFAKRLSRYSWTTWNPTNISGTFTNASSSGTEDDTDYTSMANSSGTLTITFDVAGIYLISLSYATNHSTVYTVQSFSTTVGGTATNTSLFMAPFGPAASSGGSISASQSFLVDATASQTLTVLPKYRVIGSSGSGANHFAYAIITVLYCGV